MNFSEKPKAYPNRVFRMSRYKLLVASAAALLVFLSPPGVAAADNPFWNFSAYGTGDPQKLMQISIDSESGAEKLRIRSYLAAKVPQSREGLFSRAWMADYEGKPEESKRLYLECMERYPAFATCLNNAVVVSPGDLALRQRLLDLDPALYGYTPVREMYTSLGKTGRAAEQKAFLERMSERFAGKWIAPFLRSLEAGGRGDRNAQREALRRAVAAGDKPPFFVYQDLISLETGYFYQGGGNRLERAMELVVDYLKETRRFDEYEPWRYLMNEFADSTLYKAEILRQFVGIYDRFVRPGQSRPIPAEALAEVSSRGEEQAHAALGPWLKQLRERFAVRRASEPEVAANLLWFETATDGAMPALLPQWQQLVANAFTEKNAAAHAASALNALVAQRGDCVTAQRLAAEWDRRLAGNAAYQRDALESALCANDLASARQRSDAVARLDPGQGAGDRSDRMRVVLAEAQARAWSAQERRNPFLKQWDRKDGGRVALNIEFASGSAAIPPRYAGPLGQLARLLGDNGADDYQFDIAGHTDSRGSAALNQKLSEQRAQSVVDYLVAQGGIERGRLTASGHGSAFPLANNASDAGMQQNRRVEITPRASLRAPMLAQEGSPQGSVALSPDGRVLATSDALWDTKTRLRLRELPPASVRQMDFLPNGRVLVRLVDMSWPGRSERALELIDVASGLVMRRQLINSGAAESYAVSPDGRRLAMVNTGQVQVYALPGLELRQQRMLSVLASVGRIAWLGNERLAAAVRYGGEKLHLLAADTLATQKLFDDIDYVQTLGVAPTGKTLAAITNDGALHVWDTQNWQHKSMRLGVYADRFVFHPFEDKALIDQWNGSERKTRLLDLDAMKVLRTLDGIAKTAFTPDGRRFFFAGKQYDFASFDAKPWSERNAAADGATFGAWLADAGQLMTDDANESQLWDIASGRQIDRLVGLRLCGQVKGSPSLYWQCNPNGASDTMVERGSWRRIANPDGFKRNERQSLEVETASRLVIFERDPAPSAGRVAKRGKLLIAERASGRVLAAHPVLLRLEDALYSSDDALDRGDVSTAVDPSGRYLALRVWWKEHWGYKALSGKQVWVFDLETGREVDRVATGRRVETLAFTPAAAPRLRVGFDTYTGVYDLARKEWDRNEAWSAKELLLAESGALKVVSLDDKLTLLDADGPERYVFLRKRPDRVELYPAQNLMLVYLGNGEYDYYDLKTLSRQLTLHAKRAGEWIAYAPGGEFAASLKGADGYYWALGDKYLPFAALRERFERPDVIARQLQNVLRGAAAAPAPLVATSLRQDSGSAPAAPAVPLSAPAVPAQAPAADGNAAAPAIEADLFMPPFALRLIDPPARSREPKLNLKVGIAKLRAIGADPEVELSINGQQVKTRGLARVSGGKACDAKTQADCEQVLELPVNLDDGRNVVQVSLLYRNARLDTKTSVIELERQRQAGAAAPRLWLFAAGVSQYAESRQNLKFAHRDAEELAKLFKAQEGKLFSQVNTKVLTNQQVAKGSLDTEINRFLRQATEQDLIVILLAGHGVQDNDQTLYFMTHDANLEEPFSGLDVARIRGILRNRPPNQKAILLLDICHAGALGEGRRGSVSAEDAIKQLTQGTGIMVLSSSTGRELSNEAENYRGGHGAFTAAVLEGIEGAADREAGNRDGVVSIQELTTFVMRRVPELTRNSQHPTTPSSERLQDFPVAVKP